MEDEVIPVLPKSYARGRRRLLAEKIFGQDPTKPDPVYRLKKISDTIKLVFDDILGEYPHYNNLEWKEWAAGVQKQLVEEVEKQLSSDDESLTRLNQAAPWYIRHYAKEKCRKKISHQGKEN